MELFTNIQLTEPLWLLIVPAGIAILIYIHLRRQSLRSLTSWIHSLSRDVYRHPAFAVLQPEPADASRTPPRAWLFKFGSYTLLLILVGLSLAQPYRIGAKLPKPPEHRDIVFIVDTSVSMVLQDYLVNGQRTQRMSVLKNVLTHFVDQLQGNRIQIIAYSEQAYTLVPLTTDYALIKFQLQRLKPASLTGRSSDLGRALLYALQPYQQHASQKSKQAKEAQPVFVMLTDADRPVRDIDPRVAAEYVAQQGIRLHTIAIGAGSYEAEDKERVSLVYHPTSFYLLEQIAKRGNGQFFWAKDSDSLSNALLSINEAEKRRIETKPEYIQQPLYFWPLLAALFGLALLHLVEFVRGRDTTC